MKVNAKTMSIAGIFAVLVIFSSACSKATVPDIKAAPVTTPEHAVPATSAPSGSGTVVQATVRDMSITLDTAVVPAGKVTFDVANNGPSTHEFVVLNTKTPAGKFPVTSFEGEADRFNEDAEGLTNVGEAGEVKPGSTAVLTIDLKPGHYAIVCNLPGHYAAGMHQDLEVTSG